MRRTNVDRSRRVCPTRAPAPPGGRTRRGAAPESGNACPCHPFSSRPPSPRRRPQPPVRFSAGGRCCRASGVRSTRWQARLLLGPASTRRVRYARPGVSPSLLLVPEYCPHHTPVPAPSPFVLLTGTWPPPVGPRCRECRRTRFGEDASFSKERSRGGELFRVTGSHESSLPSGRSARSATFGAKLSSFSTLWHVGLTVLLLCFPRVASDAGHLPTCLDASHASSFARGLFETAARF